MKMTELQYLKEAIEDGDSCIEAYEHVDLDKMTEEGDGGVAEMIATCLVAVEMINNAAGIE